MGERRDTDREMAPTEDQTRAHSPGCTGGDGAEERRELRVNQGRRWGRAAPAPGSQRAAEARRHL